VGSTILLGKVIMLLDEYKVGNNQKRIEIRHQLQQRRNYLVHKLSVGMDFEYNSNQQGNR
jgi:hypothetical protein